MARQVIILDQTGLPSDANYNVAFWLAVPATRQSFYANATATSRVIGATAAELLAIQTGSVYEVVLQSRHAANTPLVAIEAGLAAQFSALQAALNNQNPWALYGTSWDGATWTVVTVS